MKRIKLFILSISAMVAFAGQTAAQQYTGLTGLIHVPTAEMNREGDARIGMHLINKEMLPDAKAFKYRDRKYHSFSHYLSITPFWWVEAGYTCTLFKTKDAGGDIGGYGAKDRYLSLKLNPLRESKYLPAIAVGFNDYMDSRSSLDGSDGELYFGNVYIAATKHLSIKGNELAVHAAYRKYRRSYNEKWQGIVGGLTLRPEFMKSLRAIAEYDGDGINIGADCLLIKHFLVQVSLQKGAYLSGGLCYQLNLF